MIHHIALIEVRTDPVQCVGESLVARFFTLCYRRAVCELSSALTIRAFIVRIGFKIRW
jgi:hypothetical protein